MWLALICLRPFQLAAGVVQIIKQLTMRKELAELSSVSTDRREK
jgi:hypothetical protein